MTVKRQITMTKIVMFFGENKKIDNLIVTDIDLGLPDNSNDF